MPSSFGDVSAQLDQVTAKAEQAISALVQASELAEGAGELIESAIAGTTEQTEAARVLAIFGTLQQEATALINGPAEIPTRLFKIDTSYTGEHAALHYAGPADPRTAAGVVEAWMLGATTENDQVFSEQIYDLVRANIASAAPSEMEPDDAAWVTRVVDEIPQDVHKRCWPRPTST